MSVIAMFPEAAFGPALNSVGVAQACEKLGHKVVFLTDPGMSGVYQGYGFEEHEVNMSEPMSPEAMAKYWSDFINGHISNFDLLPFEQIDNYVKECWDAIVETAVWAEKDLLRVLDKVQPDLICVDNAILFPAIKRYARDHDKLWVRIISCSENEIPDPDIPPTFLDAVRMTMLVSRNTNNAFLKSCAQPMSGLINFLSNVGKIDTRLGNSLRHLRT